jgi:protein-L-isoaspartate(D-aspartate) O-methyltransferase
MVDLDTRAAVFREQMIASLRRLGVVDEMVLRVLASVPRHRFVDRFWAVTPATMWKWDNSSEYDVAEDSSDETLALLYDPMTAVAIRRPSGHLAATTSLSAPVIVAMMLSEMGVGHGSRVMEIGTGSGYNAALIAELVGDPALVTTVDIDPSLTADAVPRLERLGYGAITVSCRDGTDGVPERAPFDRVVATVGCVDIAPAWVDQLADGGGLLAPLEHGPMHPRVAVRRSAAALVGTFMGRSGFVRIQGSQASHRVWTGPAPVAVQYRVEWLPAGLADAFDPPDAESPRRRSGLWDFATYLGIRDRRAVAGPGLGHHSSLAVIRGDTLAIAGPGGGALAERILAIGNSWLELGCPGHDRYAMTFTIKGADPAPPDTPDGPWAIDRIDYRQRITLAPENR